VGSKLAKLGTVNSADRRKPKYAKVQAAQNIVWSKVVRFIALNIVSIKESEIGSRCEEGEP